MSESKPKLTRWFKPDAKPARAGIYMVRTRLHYSEDRPSYSYFDGEHWNGSWHEVDTASEHAGFYATSGAQGSCELLTKWRGLTRPAT